MKNRIAVLALVFIAGSILGCGSKKEVVAHIGTTNITKADFTQRLDEASYYYSSDFLATENGKRQVLDGIVKETVLAQAARKKGLDKTEAFKKAMDQMLVTEMIKEMKKKELEVTDKDIQDYYNNHKDFYQNPRELKVAHILVATKPQAENTMNTIKAGGDFASLATTISLDTVSGKKGGELDWFSMGDMVPEFETAAFALKNKGDMSGIVETKFGYHIMKLLDTRTGKSIPLEEAAPKISRIIEKEKFDAWFLAQEKKQRVKINDKLLGEIKLEKQGARI